MCSAYTCILCAHAHALEFEWARTFTRMVMKDFMNVRLSDLMNVQNNVHLNFYLIAQLNVYFIAQLNVQLNGHLNSHDDAKARSNARRNTPQYFALFLTTLAFHIRRYQAREQRAENVRVWHLALTKKAGACARHE